jgi:hypothetical protein
LQNKLQLRTLRSARRLGFQTTLRFASAIVLIPCAPASGILRKGGDLKSSGRQARRGVLYFKYRNGSVFIWK